MLFTKPSYAVIASFLQEVNPLYFIVILCCAFEITNAVRPIMMYLAPWYLTESFRPQD